jgi:hypothetical protein
MNEIVPAPRITFRIDWDAIFSGVQADDHHCPIANCIWGAMAKQYPDWMLSNVTVSELYIYLVTYEPRLLAFRYVPTEALSEWIETYDNNKNFAREITVTLRDGIAMIEEE